MNRCDGIVDGGRRKFLTGAGMAAAGAAAATALAPEAVRHMWPSDDRRNGKPLDPGKFKDPLRTATGDLRAHVALKRLATLWINTGTLCNITCRNCYIESSPRNDRFAYFTVDDIRPYLDEIKRDRLGTREIGFTGGEPFMNPNIIAMLEECLGRGFNTLVLSNGMRPMMRHKQRLIDLNKRYGARLVIRVSLDHYTTERHEDERGVGTFSRTRDGLIWLATHGFNIAVAGRTMWGEDETAERAGYGRFFAAHAIPTEAADPGALLPPADSEHSSFGCQDKVKWTYFGDAFFNTALRRTADLRQAFDAARAIVRQRELHYHLVPSNPQIAGGKNIDPLLAERIGAEAR
jgi:uncharacterized Fe-S cluster-containing radical SAM superfamily protein